MNIHKLLFLILLSCNLFAYSGYQDKIRIIKSLNGKKIKNFHEFVNVLKAYDGKFIQIETPGNMIILDTAKVKKVNAEILVNYGIEAEGVY